MNAYFEKPKLNGKEFSEFGCRLESWSVGSVQTSDGYIAQSWSYRPIGLYRNYSVRPISITCVFMGHDLRDTTHNISGFASALQDDCDLLLPDGFYYFCRLADAGTPIMDTNFMQTVTYTLYGYRHEKLSLIHI